jgi:pimeloyl-ACP methyl ester carboxylesterase
MKRLLFLFIALTLLGAGQPTLGAQPAAQSVPNEAGFMSIEPVMFNFQYGSYFNRLSLTSSQARIWYSFQAADLDGPGTPIFVFFNGGPGSATSSGLMSMYTGRYTLDNSLDQGGNAFIPNPVSWTSLGHLLYIDARQAGFSYNLMNQPENEGERFQEFNAQNFNSLFDAADYIRLLLRFLGSHPTLQSRPVVIVGESYGGTRATAMLHILLNYRDYANGTEVYQDPALVQEIQNHLEAVFPEYAGQTLPPEVIARQFGHQVLIEPTISFGYQLEIQDEMFRQPGSPLYQMGEEVGVPFDPGAYPDVYEFIENVAHRDPYIYSKPDGWLNGFFSNAGLLLRTVQNLIQVTGVDVTSIGELYASARRNAYRLITASSNAGAEPGSSDRIIQELFEIPARLEDQNVLVEPGDISLIFGTLQPWDQYFLTSNGPANWAFHVFNIAMVRGYDIHFYEHRYGRMFLKNLAYVQTFITNAPLDLVVYAAAVPPCLARHTELVSSVEHVTVGPEARPGQIVVHYAPGAFPELPDITSRTIRFPIYAQSAHAVSLTQPLDFYQDVSLWLKEHGIDLP